MDRAGIARELISQKVVANLTMLAGFILESMRRHAPVRTGRLRDSFSCDVDPAAWTATFHVPVPYGVYQEFGTRYMSPHPFVRPAFLEAARKWPLGGLTIQLNPPAQKSEPLRATRSGFTLPRAQPLTAAQARHVRKNLAPVSKSYAAKFGRRGVAFRVIGP